jgi:DNA-binding NarL/FixJ family response regulator
VQAQPPDVILMDIRLPGAMDGIETAQSIRACCQVPIIFMSGYSDAETVARVGQIDLAFLLEKPVFSGQLDQAIKLALDQR